MMTASAAGLHAAVNASATVEAHAKSKKKRKEMECQDEDLVGLSTQLGKSLPALLDKYAYDGYIISNNWLLHQ